MEKNVNLENSADSLSSSELVRLVASVGNSEAKSITLLSMKPGVIYDRKSLKDQVVSMQGNTIGWDIHPEIPYDYCRDSLSPIGLVAYEVSDKTNTYGYMITDEGQRFGIPLAGLMLDFSLRHTQVDLKDLFASTASSEKVDDPDDPEAKKRAALTRVNLFRALVETELPITVSALAKKINADPDHLGQSHLEQLSNAGIIVYSFPKEGERFAMYQLSSAKPDRQPNTVGTKVKLTKALYELVVAGGQRSWTVDELVSELTERGNISQIGYDTRDAVARVMSNLAIQGFIDKINLSKFERTKVSLEPRQREILVELTAIINSYQNQDPETLNMGRTLAYNLTEADISSLMAKIRRKSTKLPPAVTEGYIREILTKDRRIDVYAIRRKLETDYQKTLGLKQIRRLLKNLVSNGELSKVQTNEGIIWDVAEQDKAQL